MFSRLTRARSWAHHSARATWHIRAFAEMPSLDLDDVIVTKECAKRILAVAADTEGLQGGQEMVLRLAVDGGGCSGFQYVFEMESKGIDEDDSVFERDGAKVVIDDVSLDFVRGATIDFETELIRSGFAVLNNPNAEAGCGCGASFNLKEED